MKTAVWKMTIVQMKPKPKYSLMEIKNCLPDTEIIFTEMFLSGKSNFFETLSESFDSERVIFERLC